jgi:hypothetical protein
MFTLGRTPGTPKFELFVLIFLEHNLDWWRFGGGYGTSAPKQQNKG